MKTIIYILLVFAFMASCNSGEQVRYASSSPEIDVMKTLNKAYVEQDWETYRQHYNDTAKIRYNVAKGNEASLEDAIKQFKEDHASFSGIRFLDEEHFYEMVVTDDDETWVNYWGVWSGTLKSTNQKFEVPIHITARFINGKIVAEHGYWNNTDIVLAILEAESSR